MKHAMLKAKEHLSILPIYVSLDDTVKTLVLKMYEFGVSKILIVDKEFRVIGFLSKEDIIKKMNENGAGADFEVLDEYRVKDIFEQKERYFALAYLESDVIEIINAMDSLNVNYMPVLKSPWDRVLKGFIELNEVKKIKAFFKERAI